MTKDQGDQYFAQQAAVRQQQVEARERAELWPLHVSQTLSALVKEVVALRARVDAIEALSSGEQG